MQFPIPISIEAMDDLPAEFHGDVQRVSDHRPGSYWDVQEVMLVSVMLGGLRLDRSQVVAWVGEAEVSRVEAWAAEQILENIADMRAA